MLNVSYAVSSASIIPKINETLICPSQSFKHHFRGCLCLRASSPPHCDSSTEILKGICYDIRVHSKSHQILRITPQVPSRFLNAELNFPASFQATPRLRIMATGQTKPLGVTAPLSMALPTEAENQASNALIEELKRQKNYESAVETQNRYVYYTWACHLCNPRLHSCSLLTDI